MIKCQWCPTFYKKRAVHPVLINGKTLLLCAEHREEHMENEQAKQVKSKESKNG